ncbi:WhiB family transcriptional regulator [Mycolicibacterium sp. CH28]|uniref:WhiB family transcriptional regulator n=1 Tax=Mycolicibacterium sp. CH28 TaxID=2512237 RepID=UPI0010820D63|nr:WhiB family transcriptional regulator [Mycolicibacterium sp. CH28]TGD85122.1 WhiB family transcriptional regulator [Mycolicibacterium sp. CH28]
MLFFRPDPALDGAVCRDLPEDAKDAFFAEGGSGYKIAVTVCESCPVKAACLAHALAHEEGGMRFGVYGGLTARARGRMAR